MVHDVGSSKAEQGKSLAEDWRLRSISLSDIPDPDAGRGETVRRADSSVWDLRTIANLVFEAMAAGKSVIVFCRTKMNCVNLCDELAKALKVLSDGAETSLFTASPQVTQERQNILGHLVEESAGIVHPVLQRGIAVGISFHTAALHAVERRVVEEAFARRVISVISCTTTLAAGVNLPTDRVIVRASFIGADFLACSRYLQMIVWAGRRGSDAASADSYVIVEAKHVGQFQRMVEQRVEAVTSKLLDSVTFYHKNADLREFQDVDAGGDYTGVTRVIMGILESAKMVPLADLIDAYKLTLLYQTGTSIDEDDDREQHLQPKRHPARTSEPLLKDVKMRQRQQYTNVHIYSPSEIRISNQCRFDLDST